MGLRSLFDPLVYGEDEDSYARPARQHCYAPYSPVLHWCRDADQDDEDVDDEDEDSVESVVQQALGPYDTI